MVENSTPVTRDLDRMGIPYRFFRHPGPVHSLEQAARERGQLPDQVIRSILFRTAENRFVMVLMGGPQQISWPALRKYLNQSRITMASQEDVLRVTGYLPGSVSPFGLPEPIRILVDEGILAQEEISIGSGERGTTVVMSLADLIKALGEVETGTFASSGTS